MNILVLNCGSSSVKFQLVACGGTEQVRGRGRVQRIGPEAALSFEAPGGTPLRETAPVPDHATAVRRVLQWVTARPGGARVDGVGHRIVHGGSRFVEPVLVDDATVGAIEAAAAWAPLHNAPGLAGIRAARDGLGAGVPMVAVFDTAFHATLPPHAAQYAIPSELAARHGIRRYGFHGLSYRWVVARYAELTGHATPTLVALHLGHGCSAAAIHRGRSADTSMGLTPLEGLVMGTRSGDLDPAIVGHLARAEGVTVEEVERWLNERSGLKGLAGGSSDVRDLLAAAPADPRARLALDVFCHRARKYLGAYLAALGGADAVVFTGGIGEHQPEIRARICEGMEWCGLRLDPARNAAVTGRDGAIGAEGTAPAAWVIATDEERVIARDVAALLARTPAR